MIGIHKISNYIPNNYIDNIERGKVFGHSEDFIRRRIGALKLPIKKDFEETSDLATEAVKKLLNNAELKPEHIEVLVLITQNGDGDGLPHTSAIVQKKLSLPKKMAIFDISLGCSGYVYGLTAIKGFMSEAGLKHGILITADPYSKIIDPSDRVTSLLFGDAATATWVGEGSKWMIGKPLFWSDGEGAQYLQVKNRKLEMNGRQIFNFVSQHVSLQISDILSRENLKAEDIDLYCLHQASAAIMEAVSKNFSNVRERFISNIDDRGNTVSSSIPLLLENAIKKDKVRRILLSGFGVGLSLSTTIIQKRT